MSAQSFSEQVLPFRHLTLPRADVQKAELTAAVADKVPLPFVPVVVKESIAGVVVTLTLDQIENSLPEQLRAELEAAMKSYESVAASGISVELKEKLVKQITSKIEVTDLVSQSQKEAMVRAVLDALLGDRQFGASVCSSVAGAASGGLNQLVDPQKRLEFVRRVNEQIDLPFLDEAAEEKLFMAMANAVVAGIEALVPKSCLDILDGCSTEELADFKGLVVDRLERTFPDCGVPHDKKREIASQLVSMVFDAAIMNSGLAQVLY
jgi:hypothetical protein